MNATVPAHERAAIDSIAQLRAAGFAIVPLPNLRGYVDGILATRILPDAVESVVIRGPGCAIATRIPNHLDLADPFDQPETLWARTGTATAVIDEVLT